MKKTFLIVVLITLIAYGNSFSFALEHVKVNIDGKNIDYTNETGFPYIDENGRVRVPLRKTMEAFGAKVGWIAEKETIKIEYDGKVIEISIGKNYFYFNRGKVFDDTSAIIKEGRTYVSIKIVIELLGSKVSWDNQQNTVIVDKNSKPAWEHRTWVDMPIDDNSDYKKEKLKNTQSDIKEAEEKYNQLKEKYNELTKGMVSYLVTGDVLDENEDFVLLEGIAYGLGEGMHDGIIKVLKPTSDTFFTKYNGTNFYLYDEEDPVYGIIKVYDSGSDEIMEVQNQKIEALEELNALKAQESQFKEPMFWFEKPYTMEYSDTKNIYYDEGVLYTLLYPKDTTLKVYTGGAYMTDGIYDGKTYYRSPQYYTEINKGYYSIQIYGFYGVNNKESKKCFYDNHIYLNPDKYKKMKDLINEDEGIIDAYLIDFKEYGRYEAYIFTKDGKVIYFIGYENESLEPLLEIMKSITVFPGC